MVDDVLFTNFAFPATGTTANRTMPDRLAEKKNVKDFVPNVGTALTDVVSGLAHTLNEYFGSQGAAEAFYPHCTDYTTDTLAWAAMQAAVNWTPGANRGTIFFPRGGYITNRPVTFNYDGDLSICFQGEGAAGQVSIVGTFNGYLFDRHLPTASVTISIASPGVVTDTAHGKSANDPVRFETTGALPTGLVAGTTYYVKSPSTDNYNVSATPGGTAIVTSGSQSGSHTRAALNTSGGRIFERLQMQNGHATGGCIRLGSTLGGVIRDCKLGGHICITTEDAVGVSSKNTLIQTINFSLGNGTVSGAHYIIIGGGGSIQNCDLVGTDTAVRAYGKGLHASGNRQERNNTVWLLGLDSGDNPVGLKGFSITSSTAEGNLGVFDFAGPCDGFYVGSHSIQGHNENAGVIDASDGSQYGIRIAADCAKNGVIESINISSWHEVACVEIANATSRTNLVLRNITANLTGGGGVNWTLPTNAYTAKFENVNTPIVWTFAQLPTGGNVLEGDEFDISDSDTAIWGDNPSPGGGSDRARVRFNGTNYTVVGK
jgi:hypothetical protein